MTDIDKYGKVAEQMVAYQQQKGFTDQQMADMMGCNRRTYQQTRTGKMKVGNAFLRGAQTLLEGEKSQRRTSGVIERATGETDITLDFTVDGTGILDIDTGIYMFDHLLSQIIKHGRFDMTLKATGDDPHHLIEDVGICFGHALQKALGDRKGIIRMGDASVPLDEALAAVSIDLSGRPYSVLDMEFTGNDMPGFPADMIRHFLETFAIEGRMNLHARILYGNNDHHKAESLFKSLGRALDMATMYDERIRGISPSTKGMIEGAS